MRKNIPEKERKSDTEVVFNVERVEIIHVEITHSYRNSLVFSMALYVFNGTLTHYHTIPHFDALMIYGRGKQCACTKQFLLFSQCFLAYMVPMWYLFSILNAL